MFARILALLLATSYLLLAAPVYAQTPSATLETSKPASQVSQIPPATSYPLPPAVYPTSPLYTDLLIHNMFHSFSCIAIGQSLIGQPCLSYQITQNAQGVIQSVPVLSQADTSGGALGLTTSVLEALYKNPPVKTTDYLASIGNGFGVVKTADAQISGTGAAILNPILNLWQVSRNISYLIMIIIFLIIGLMIMFRNKINPQTVITAQAALPGLVIGLIMITFSYFLAGLISDMAFVGTNIVGYYFQAAQGQPAQDLARDIGDRSVLHVFGNVIPTETIGANNQGYIAHALTVIMDNSPSAVVDFLRFAAGVMAFQYGNQIGHVVPVIGDLAGIVAGVAAFGLGAADFPRLGGLLLSWVALAILIYSMFKLLFNLIKTYLNIVFLTITAPFQLMVAALPGRQGMATGWILNMLANALVFPAVLAVLYFVAYILRLDRPPLNITAQATITGVNTFPLLGGLDSGFIGYLVAFVALTITPAIPDVINKAIGRAGAAGQLLGQEFAGNMQGGRGYSNQWQTGFQAVGKMGQDWNAYRGRPPGWSPAVDVIEKDAKLFGRWQVNTMPGLGRVVKSEPLAPRK